MTEKRLFGCNCERGNTPCDVEHSRADCACSVCAMFVYAEARDAAAHAASGAAELKKISAAAKRVIKAIDALARGGDAARMFYDQCGDVWRAIVRLDSRTSRAELRVHRESSDRADEIVRALRASMRDAEERGREAWREANDRIARDLETKAREARRAREFW